METLIQLLHSIHPLSSALSDRLRSIIKLKKYNKGDIILANGEVSNYIYFIQKGLIRSYYLLKGKEVSKWFMKEGDFCISVVSFMRQTPATETLVALEDCEVLAMTHEDLEETYRLFVEYNVNGRLIASEYYCRSIEREEARLQQTPVDKYAQLMENDPKLVLRVTNKHMASYLDVGDRTYNIIRKEYAEDMAKKAKKKRQSVS